ncbi:MAG TPA: bifunctional phosphopantothenoylcysteine decarboxylase/phosphopantothenate--cysteine ligase CoaBC [Gemmatimonadaceae bacterium]|nr:bifunctional phosphopantothenoylcysteine decarboxylase/phosphopantothenate--cysteine ligase CoaBC [Gemmatimonadaceae bacterium]
MTDSVVHPYAGRRVLLGVAGGIASYKTAWLARLLTTAGAQVDVVMTRAATEFVGAVTFEALTGRPVHTGLFDAGRALDHIALARGADVVVVAPATADLMARAATGQADDLLTAVLLATDAPVLLVPAMNDRMWAHAQTQTNAAHLRHLGYALLDPDDGMLAAGEGSGPGRMPEPETILAHVGRMLERRHGLRGRTVLVTAGPTREQIDPVRFLSNYSSGKMGVAIAAAAWRRGADVTLVAGPLAVALPVGVTHVPVQSTTEMRDAVAERLPEADLLVMAAAPADYQPAARATGKLKKTGSARTLELQETPDILTSTRHVRRDSAIVVGFALETDDLLANATRKLESKGLDMVVLNAANEPGAGFGVDTNRVTIVRAGRAEPEELPLLDKRDVADAILDRVEALLDGR